MALTRLSAAQARVLCLHYYSNALGFSFEDDEEMYREDKIKEWEPVDPADIEAFLKLCAVKSEKDETQIFVKFFKFHRSYDLIPTSAKLVVFDTQLLVKKAFFALVYNGVRAAPLWDSTKQRFVGMLTITDFIRILQMNYKSPTLEMEELEEHRLSTWREVLSDVKDLIYIHPDASLYDAIKMLIHNKIHRLPVLDQKNGNVLYILTHKRILRFLFLYIHDMPQANYLQHSILDLKIGTYDKVEVAFEDTPIIEALHSFVNKRVSALPIVDKEGRLVDIYAKFDVINLAAEKTYSNLDVSLKSANQHRNEWFEGVHKCKQDESLFTVMERIVKAEVHRLVVVDDDNKVTGVISLSDILNYLALRPGGDDPSHPEKFDMFSVNVGAVGPWGQPIPPKEEEVGVEPSSGPISKSESTDSAVEATEEVLEKKVMVENTIKTEVIQPDEEEKENLAKLEVDVAGVSRKRADCDIEKLSDLPTNTNGEDAKDRRSFAEITIQ